MSARKATGPTGGGNRRAAYGIALEAIRGARTADSDALKRAVSRAPGTSTATIIATLAFITAGLLADIGDDQLEAAVTAAYLRGMRR